MNLNGTRVCFRDSKTKLRISALCKCCLRRQLLLRSLALASYFIFGLSLDMVFSAHNSSTPYCMTLVSSRDMPRPLHDLP